MSAPRGRNKSAQGNALGAKTAKGLHALKGRDNGGVVPPVQGLRRQWPMRPGALSWAVVLLPFRQTNQDDLVLHFPDWTDLFRRCAMPSSLSIKPEARPVVEALPDDATWDDLLHRVNMRQAIETGLQDFQEGRSVSIAAVRYQLGLPT